MKLNKKKYVSVFIRTTVCLIVAIALIAGISLFFGNGKLGKIMDKKSAGERHNILVMGTDKDGTRSDVIMILSVLTKDNSINVLSVPRDTRVMLDSKYAKINSALGYGDETAISTIKEVTGIPIHDYVKFNFTAVEDVVDALGGIEFDVPQDMDYEDPYQDLYIHLKKGEQKLDGKQTLQLMRFRRYPMGDLQRISVQQDVIKAIVKQKAKLRYVFKTGSVYKAAKKNMTTTISGADVTKLAFGLLGTKTEDVKTFECPYHFSPSGTYVIINSDELSEIADENFK